LHKMADVEKGETKPSVGPDGRPLGPDGKPLPGPAQMQQIMAQKRMAQQQAQVNEVVDIMRNNVEKVLERDQKLNELDEKADALQDGASQFEKSAGKLKNKFWMENMKTIVAGSIVGLLVLGFIYWNYFSGSEQPQPAYNPNYYPPQQNMASNSNNAQPGGDTEASEES